MMGIGPEEAARMSLWTFQAIRHHWNERHATDATPVEAPDADRVARNMERLTRAGIASG